MIETTRRAICLWLGAAGVPFAVHSAEAPLAADDARGLRSVIEAQLAAFQADNAEQAFSYASASIREMFGTAERFLAMVRGSYPAVYRPKSVAFFVPERVGSEVMQRVRLTDQAGAAWLAHYSMQRQADRSWRINGCVVTRDAGRHT